MKYLKTLTDGERVNGIYMVKSKNSALTKMGKEYENVVLQDKTGTMDCKIWDPNSAGICDFDAMDFIEVSGKTNSFNGMIQMSIERARKVLEGEYDPADYVPTSSRNVEDMWKELLGYLNQIKNPYLAALRDEFFVKDEDFIKKFKASSAAKSIHHGFVGGLLEHSCNVTRLCDTYAKFYPILNRDLLVLAASLHDIGKLRELSLFPTNDYTDEGQLLGHIIIGVEMVDEKLRKLPDFPEKLANELKHLIVSHHGELEYGSPKKPALIEGIALSMADNLDAKMEQVTELFNSTESTTWLGFNKLLDSNIRKTSQE